MMEQDARGGPDRFPVGRRTVRPPEPPVEDTQPLSRRPDRNGDGPTGARYGNGQTDNRQGDGRYDDRFPAPHEPFQTQYGHRRPVEQSWPGSADQHTGGPDHRMTGPDHRTIEPGQRPAGFGQRPTGPERRPDTPDGHVRPR
ncbi:MAG TPA: hypothetical protein VGD43_07140, partial [Micromonospora sp.]